MLLALFLAAIQFSPARVLCVHDLPYLVINAWQATALLQMRFTDLVHHDPNPIHLALWRVAYLCAVVHQDAPGSAFFSASDRAASSGMRVPDQKRAELALSE